MSDRFNQAPDDVVDNLAVNSPLPLSKAVLLFLFQILLIPFAVAMVYGIGLGVSEGLAAAAQGQTFADVNFQATFNAHIGYVIFLAGVATAVVIPWCAKRWAGATWSRAGIFGIGFSGFSQWRSAMIIGVTLGVVLTLLSAWFPPQQPLAQTVFAHFFVSWPMYTLFALFAVVLAPLYEEIVFRGALLAGLARRWGNGVAVLISSAVFVAIHLSQVQGYWVAIIGISALALILALMRLRFGVIGPGIVLHASYNAVAVLASVTAVGNS